MKPADIERWNALPRRVEGGGFIRWYMNDKCDALVHDESFRAKLREHGFG